VLPDGELTAQATVIHRGRTIAVVNCEIRDDQGKLAAAAMGSVLILPGRHWERPVHVADEVTPEASRVLTTVLFIDIVDSTQKTAALGDRRWRETLGEYQSAVRQEIQRFRGSEVDSIGDGFLVAFDSAARAVRCAAAVRAAVRPLDLEIRAGVHAGEVERSGGKLVGIAVHTGSRIEALAAPGEILVSSLVKELVAGSGIAFEDRGEHELKGVPGSWKLFAAVL
jgi:class 3 adenylate cyclase